MGHAASTSSTKVYIAKAISANSIVDNGATVTKGGNIDSSATVTTAPWSTILTREDRYGSKVPNPETDATIAAGTDTSGTYKPYTAGTFAYIAANRYVVRRYTNYISGVANTLLNSGASETAYRDGIKKNINRRSIDYASWDWATGAATITSVDNNNFAMGATGTDDAASPTRAVPGELVYHHGDKDGPTTDEYQAKKG